MSPVDTDIVTFLLQNILIATSGTQEQQVTIGKAVGYGFLMRQVERPLRSNFEVEFDLMRLSIISSNFIRDIVDRT